VSVTQTRYITLPHLTCLQDLHLHYEDILTYAALKSYNNSVDDLCYPSYETVAQRSGFSCKFVRQSIARLEKSGLVRIKKSKQFRKSNKYWFDDITSFNRIPFDVLYNKELNLHEKSLILCLHQFFITSVERTKQNLISYVHRLGIGTMTFERWYNGLLKKGFIIECIASLPGDAQTVTCELTGRINWFLPDGQSPG
jgi:hypothetical protein